MALVFAIIIATRQKNISRGRTKWHLTFWNNKFFTEIHRNPNCWHQYMDILNFDLTTWIKSFRGKRKLHGSEDAALVAHIDVNIGSLFTKYVVDKTRFTRRYKVYVVIAMQTNAHNIIHVPATQALGHLHPCKS